MSFFDEFNQIVPYFVKVTVGKNKQFKTDVSKKGYANHKGKMIAVYRKAKTIEELEKYGLGEYMEYLLAEQVSLPIDVQVTSPESISAKVEGTSKFTNRNNTSHRMRIYDINKNQVGYTSIDITPAGDITHKYSSYESHDRRNVLTHVISRGFLNGELSIGEHFTFEKYDEQGSKSIEITQKDGKVIGAIVTERELQIKENIKFPKIRESVNYINSRKVKSYVASCVTDETDMSKRGGTYMPWGCSTLEDDLNHLGLLREFKGQYIGNILKLVDNGYEACIVTKHQKDGQDYKLYTLIDLTDVDITQGTGLEAYESIGRDHTYFEKLKSADKTPTFVTRMGKDGKEELVLYDGNTVPRECPEYEQFVKGFIAPFSEIRPVQISKFLNKGKEK